jgi:hypothetical protein
MIPCTQEVKEALQARRKPQALLVITTRGGQYIYSDQRVEPEAQSALGRPRFDGTRRFDGTWSFGSAAAVLGGGRKVKKWAVLREALSTSQRSLKAGLNQNDPDNLSVSLTPDAAPLPVGARAELRLVWPGVAVRDGLAIFRGEIKSRRRSLQGITYKLVSVGQGLRDSLKLPVTMKTASAYADPRREAQKLPLVYGDMTQGGAGGQWEAVCLDTTAFVYALAGHELDGGVELFDKDGNQINPSEFTLNLAHDYQGKGTIATATFAADAKDLEPIGVRARGKPGDAGLLTNPVDIARDLLLNHCGVAATELHGASWAKALAVCQAQGYEAARAIAAEAKRGDLLTGLLSNFVVYWWIGGDGLIRLLADGGSGYIDAGSIAGHLGAKIVHDAGEFTSTDDICNQLKVKFAPNLTGDKEWQGEDGGESTRDAISQQRHQVRLWEAELPWVRTAPVANQVQAVRVSRLGRAKPRWTVTVPDCRLAHVERGDYLTVSSDWLVDEDGLPLSYQITRIEQAERDPATGGMKLTLLDTGYFRTTARRFDGSWAFDGQGKFGGERYKEAA